MPERPAREGDAAAEGRFRLPAEWEPHAATWLAWPHEPDTWPGVFDRVAAAWVAMARALREGEEVRLLSRDDAMDAEIRAAFDNDLAGIRLVRCATTDVWIRDYGPTFVHTEDDGRTALAAVDWTFNAWGEKYEWMLPDDGVAARVASAAQVEVVPGGMVLEGGSIDADGEGTLLTTESCLLSPRRNPALTRADIETRLAALLGASRVLWLGDGIAGDDTDGHVDDLTRFVAPGRVVTALEPDERDENHRPLRENRERLARLRDAAGRRLEIVDLPMPAPLVHTLPGGERVRAPASYANFYIGNACVLVPTFRSSRDTLALGVLGELFPERRIVGVDCHDVVLGLGAIHCVTQQQPAPPG